MTLDTNPDAGSRAAADDRDPPGADKNRAFLRLFLQNERRLYAYIFALLPNRADADDLLQEVSLALWDTFDASNPPAHFLAWARRIAYYKALNFHKQARRFQHRLSEVFLERVAEAAAEQADVLQLDDRREALAGCVEKLAPRDRDLLTRRFTEGATTRSTSEELGRSVEAVYKALAKIRQMLFDCVQRTLDREGHK